MKCTHCGGEVLIRPDSRIGICTRCMSEIPIPDTSVSESLYEQAGKALRESRFDEAIAIYQELLIQNPNDAAVCWGMALGQYGIEYVTDPATGEQLPTLHRLSLDRFSEYLYAKKAVDLSWNTSDRDFYRNQCAAIDAIQTESLHISSQEIPVDIFICYKRSESFDQGNSTTTVGSSSVTERRTADSRMAADYYNELTRRGYKVFFAEKTLRVGEEYEPRIFAALRSAKIMIALATREEYYEAVWVQNEWSRYLDLIEQDLKSGGSTQRLLIPVFNHMSHDELPAGLAQMPSFVDMQATANPKMTLLNLVAAHFDRGDAEDVSALLRQVRGSSGVDAHVSDTEESAAKTRTLATIRLVNGEFEEAKSLFTRAIRQKDGANDPENYLGLLMCSLRLPGKEALAQYIGLIDDDPNFRKALDAAKGDAREELLKIAKNCRENLEWRDTVARKKEECEAAVKALRTKEGNALSTFAEMEKRCREYDELERKKSLPHCVDVLIALLFWGIGVPMILLALFDIQNEYFNILGIFQIVVTIAVIKELFTGPSDRLGCFGMILSLLLALGAMAGAFMIEAMNWDNKMPFVLAAAVSIALAILLGLLFSSRKLKREIKWMRRTQADLPKIAEHALTAYNQETDAAVAPYRGYYEESWEAFTAGLHQANTALIEEKQESLAIALKCRLGGES